MTTLTEAEVEQLRDACADGWTDPAVAVTIIRAVKPTVEAIVAARLAGVADDLAAQARLLSSGPGDKIRRTTLNVAAKGIRRQIRGAAVLGSDAHTEQKGAARVGEPLRKGQVGVGK